MSDAGNTVEEDVAGLIRRRWKRVAAMTLAVLLVLGGAFTAGYFTGDDSEQVDRLKLQLAETNDEHADAEADVEKLEDENLALESDVEKLQDRLAAELNLKGETTSDGSRTGASVVGDLRIGQAGKAGPFTLKPTSFERADSVSDGYETISPDEGTVFYVARITVKNDGQEAASPFCSGGGQLLDDSDRRYDAESLLADDTANCQDIQPGALKDNFEIYFQVPTDAKPQTMLLSGDDYSSEGDGTAWDVG